MPGNYQIISIAPSSKVIVRLIDLLTVPHNMNLGNSPHHTT